MPITTISGGIIQNLDAANLPNVGNKTFLDEAPEDTIPPYITYNDNVSMLPELSGDASTQFYSRNMQFNLWQIANEESPTLPGLLLGVLDGMRVKVDSQPFTALLKAVSVTRIEEPLDTGLTHHEITVAIVHTAAMM